MLRLLQLFSQSSVLAPFRALVHDAALARLRLITLPPSLFTYVCGCATHICAQLSNPRIARAADEPPASTSPATTATDSSLVAPGSLWIVKPAASTNRGCGIKMCNGYDEVMTAITTPSSSVYNNRLTKKYGFIVQKYMEQVRLARSIGDASRAKTQRAKSSEDALRPELLKTLCLSANTLAPRSF